MVEKIAAGAVAEVDDAYGSARRLLGLRMPGATAPALITPDRGRRVV